MRHFLIALATLPVFAGEANAQYGVGDQIAVSHNESIKVKNATISNEARAFVYNDTCRTADGGVLKVKFRADPVVALEYSIKQSMRQDYCPSGTMTDMTIEQLRTIADRSRKQSEDTFMRWFAPKQKK
jgi:hypothetical protein